MINCDWPKHTRTHISRFEIIVDCLEIDRFANVCCHICFSKRFGTCLQTNKKKKNINILNGRAHEKGVIPDERDRLVQHLQQTPHIPLRGQPH